MAGKKAKKKAAGFSGREDRRPVRGGGYEGVGNGTHSRYRIMTQCPMGAASAFSR